MHVMKIHSEGKNYIWKNSSILRVAINAENKVNICETLAI